MVSKDFEPYEPSGMLLYIMRYWKYFIGLVLLSACNFGPSCSRISDAHITYIVHGQKIVISDSVCSGGGGFAAPAAPTMRASFLNSIFTINGYTYNGSIHFVFRCSSDSSGNFPDTGTSMLNFQDSAFHWITIDLSGNQKPTLNFPGLVGNAIVATDSQWTTDSLHKGLIKITNVDVNSGTFSGIFNFTGVNLSAGSPQSDTIRVDSGIITNMRFSTY